MNEYKTKKLAEFEKQFGIPDYMNDLLKEPLKVVIEEQKQFISDLIDEIVGAIPEAKDETYIVNCIQCKDENAKS